MKTQFDAIVVGSGITGGWAAKELTEKGLKVLVLERGRHIEHVKDYVTEHKGIWDFKYRTHPDRELYDEEYPIQQKNHAFNETTRHYFNNDKKNPYDYNDEKPFYWLRGDVLGGRSLTWGRQVYRFSDYDFQANKKDGHGVDWPIRYSDIKPWYSYVEKFIGVSGQAENLPQLPDGEFLKPMELSKIERVVKEKIEQNYTDRMMTIGRAAILTEPHNGRAPCHYCGPCHRGCMTGSYFSSQSSTLPAAQKTNNLTIKTDCVVERLEYDAENNRVSGITVIDAKSLAKTTYSAKLVFLCASTVASTQILLNSKSTSFPNGLANSSGALGHYLMDHTIGLSAMGTIPGYEEHYTYGNRPNGSYIPRFRNLDKQDTQFKRGYAYQGYGARQDWRAQQEGESGFGKDFKETLQQPGPWTMVLIGFGEALPRYENSMRLSETKVDRFGIPQVEFNFEWTENELEMRVDMAEQGKAMLEAAGAEDIITSTHIHPGGGAIHEMGTARMGLDPKTSVLNQYNQSHDVPNLFVTDGSCMTSGACVNPSLTYMALTARAVDFAVKQLEQGVI
jgi:glucoside 3-dehydrogenase (cytochrome c) catalytic subunit